MKLQPNWIEIYLIEKSSFNKEPIQGKATCPDGIVYYAGLPVSIDGKYFIKEEQVIAYE